MRMRRAAALLTTTVGLLTALLAPATAAQAADGATKRAPGGLTTCNHRAQSIYSEFPLRGHLSTVLIRPGACLSVSLDGGRASEQVVVYADHSGHYLAVDHFFFDSRTWYTRHVY